MTRSATDLMQDILAAAVLDALAALKAASKGLPNNLLRDINAIHANTTFADLPPELQAAIGANVRAAFTRLLKEGYAIGPAGREAPRRGPPRPSGPTGEHPRRGPGGPGANRPRGERPGGRGPGGHGPGGHGPGGRGPGGPQRTGRPPKPRG